MGVQNLWVLLAPVGRKIEIESLAGQVLAVDASIWLTQFVKAMRDDEGNMIRNAHLMGTLHRVAKLLFYGVRPVFVFDGQTPEIKKRTTARRRKRQEQQSANLRHTAQRILLNRLKQARQELKKNGGAPAPAVAPGFTLPEASNAREEEEEVKGGELEVEQVVIEEVEEKSEENEVEMVWEAAAEQEKEDEELTLDDIELDTSRLSKIDLHAVFSLPPHLQKDMIQKILRDRRQEVRDQFIPLAGNPEKYSRTQISSFLQTSELNRRIEAAKKQKQEEEMESQGGVGQGHRIDSNSNRFYIYQKDAEQKEEKNEDNVVAEVERTDMEERASGVGVVLPQHERGSAFKMVEKKPLSEFASGKTGFIPDAEATEVTAAWVARHQVRVKQEPVLAIEQLRLARLKQETPASPPESTSKTSTTQAKISTNQTKISTRQIPVHDVSISLKVADVDPDEMARFQQLFPGSATKSVPTAAELSKPEDEDEDEEVDWEEVKGPAMEQRSSVGQEILDQSSKAETVAEISSSRNIESTTGSDDEMEWEDVPSAEQNQLPTEEKLDSLSADLDVHNVDDQNEEDGTDELFLTLKNEMEDAKAHEDLDLLKDEALQSAMVTASNLTQWAAGAVRRALQAHSLQHGGSIGVRGSPVGTRPGAKSSPAKGTAAAPLELSDEEDESMVTAADTGSTEVVVIDEDESTEDATGDTERDSQERLQAALAASIASEQEEEKTGSARVRYLQYSEERNQPSTVDDTHPEVDEAALQKEQLELKKLRSRQLRDTEGITDDMVAEVMALLRLFGVPFLVSPMEAEAQCAALEQLGLVDGVITDDSDIFPFGGKRVYKNIFHHQKFVEAFSARDIEQELGFSREQIIALALLLGSDYTDGVRGIGIVNASEIAVAYPGIEGLREFKEWVREFDVAEEAKRVAAGSMKKKKKTNKEEDDESEDSDESDSATTRERFQRSHATARRKWELGDEFPSKQVVQAYMTPQVDRSDARFSWSAPDLAALRNYCANAFGWDSQKSDGVLQPLEEKAKTAAAGGRHIQTRLDRFFTSYDDQVHYAQIKSKRLRSAVTQRNSSKSKKQRK
ncbi:DNA repair protein UVH3 [Phytophthora citrophthora]|uniref:DNA repair protein UVH3 n=1 Tax=Phytophthora citrophthora TaxID=4793 RepID=A0AAD9LJ07_9STRA|nr:DNA repair protein UVH3 [Phytophthora citrophthora]